MLDQRTQPPAKAIKQIEVYTMQAGHMIQKVVTLSVQKMFRVASYLWSLVEEGKCFVFTCVLVSQIKNLCRFR
jgi:hypothetical protein